MSKTRVGVALLGTYLLKFPFTCPALLEIVPALPGLPEIIQFELVVITPDVKVKVPVMVSFTDDPPRVTPDELLIVRFLKIVAEVPLIDCWDPLLFKLTVPLL